MASKPGPLSEWPWQDWGDWKYLLYAPFALAVATGHDDDDSWCRHMCQITLLRYAIAQFFISLSRIHAVTSKTRIQKNGISYQQIDREDHWDDYMLLQAYVATAVHFLPYLGYNHFQLYSSTSLWWMLAFHAGPAEFLYYWLHRALHHHVLYAAYHSHHHQSFVTEPITGSVHPFMEHIVYTAVFAIPLLGPHFAGHTSVAMFYAYLIGFDFLNAIGHCNFEFMPQWFMTIPGMKYLIYSPSYHSLHHSRLTCNYCLFLPLYDYLFDTIDPKSDALYEAAIQGKAVDVSPPNVVFVGHGTTLTSAFHAPFALRSFSSRPFEEQWWMKFAWPACFMVAVLLRLFGRPYVHDRHRLMDKTLETWVTPAFAIQFFFKSQWAWINSKIQEAIMSANDSGVKVIGLGALNKNEALNRGGKLFVDRLDKDGALKVRVVHGNTLTAAAVLQKISSDVETVFVTGATSKLGRAISLHLAETRGVKVIMYTQSPERFEAIRMEAKEDARHLLVHATKMEAGANVQDWIVGKFCSPTDQALAPPKATFHQFVVPPLQETRSDCTYTQLPAFRLPPQVRDFKTCEMTMQRGCVHACHAGAIVHLLEGWQHHEVGTIDHTRIDETWAAATRHGFVLQ